MKYKYLILLLLLPILAGAQITVDNFDSGIQQVVNSNTGVISLDNYAKTVDSFVSTWKTDNIGDSDDNQITLPLVSDGVYDFTVDWGDGSGNTIKSYIQSDVTHTYSTAGTYEIFINGNLNGWRFNTTGDAKKIINISQWGDLIVGDYSAIFSGCENMTITATDILDVSGNTTLLSFFNRCKSITYIPNIGLWDVSNVVYFSYMFNITTAMISLDLSGWDVSSGILMRAMFGAMTNVTTLGDLSGWDVAKVTDMRNMYQQHKNYTIDYLDSWDVSSLTYGALFITLGNIDIDNYSDLLYSWGHQAVKSNVTFDGGTSKYDSIGKIGRDILTDTYGWIITDGGYDSSYIPAVLPAELQEN